MKRLLLLTLLLAPLFCWPAHLHAQLWSGVLDPSRATDWTYAGISGGIPSGSWTQCGPTIAAYNGSGATILNALQHTSSGYTGCGANTYVQLAAGTFNLTSGVSVIGMSNDELRGMGANSTILNFSGMSTCLGGAGVCGVGFASSDSTYATQPPAHIYNWTAGYSQGTTSITVSSGTAIVANQTMVVMDQCDTGYSGAPCAGNSADNGGFFECSDGYVNPYGCSVNGPDSGFARPHRFEIEAAMVTACSPSCGSSGSTVLTIDRPLIHPNWASGQTPQVWLIQTAQYVGIQNLTLNLAGCSSSGGGCTGGGLGFSNVAYYWASGVSVLNSYNIGIWIGSSIHGIIQSNYVYNAGQHLNYADPTGIKYNWSNNLIQNNIVQAVRPFIQEEGPASGNVVAYNFGINSYTGDDFLFSGLLAHSTGDDYNLYEGNVTDQDTQDQIHGSHLMQTAFRNLFTGWESCGNGNCGSYAHKDSNVAALLDLSYNRYYNAIANVLGTPGGPSSAGYSYQNQPYPGAGGVAGYPYYLSSGDNAGTYVVPADPIVLTTLMRWGNWDAYYGATRWVTSEVPSGISPYANPVPTSSCTASLSCPPSFYTSRPSWYSSSIPFPAIGPDVTGGNLGVCKGTLDASGQFGGVAAYSSSQCAGQGWLAAWGGHANAIPAMVCYLGTMNGPPDGSGSALPFSAANCYPPSGSTAATPTFSPSSGTPPQTVTISCSTPGCTINYTEDGSTPTTGSPAYSTPLSITANPTVLKAIGNASGYAQSAVGTATYSGNPTASTPTFTLNGSPTTGGNCAYQNPITVTTSSPSSNPYVYWSSVNPPTSSSNNSNNLQCLATVTIYAKVIGSPGYTDSAVGSAAFTLTGTPSPPTGVSVIVIGP